MMNWNTRNEDNFRPKTSGDDDDKTEEDWIAVLPIDTAFSKIPPDLSEYLSILTHTYVPIDQETRPANKQWRIKILKQGIWKLHRVRASSAVELSNSILNFSIYVCKYNPNTLTQ